MAAALGGPDDRRAVPTAKALTQILVQRRERLSARSVGRSGRRAHWAAPGLFCACACFRCCCAAGCSAASTHYGAAFLVLVTLVGRTTAAFYGWLPLYLPELFPTRVRATGQGLCYNSGRILAAVGALTQGQLVAAYAGSYAKAGATYADLPRRAGDHLAGARRPKDKPLPEYLRVLA